LSASPLAAKLSELRAITARIESGKLSLEESLAEYDRGVALGREIAAELAAAEQKVDVIQPDGTLVPFPRLPGGTP